MKDETMVIQDRIKEIDDAIEKLDCEKRELEKKMSGWFIVNEFCGNPNYWDEYLHPAGFITLEKAKKLADSLNGDEFYGSMPEYYAVTEEEYKKYMRAARLTTAMHAICCDDDLKQVYNKLRITLANLMEELGIEYGFINVSDPMYV